MLESARSEEEVEGQSFYLLLCDTLRDTRAKALKGKLFELLDDYYALRPSYVLWALTYQGEYRQQLGEVTDPWSPSLDHVLCQLLPLHGGRGGEAPGALGLFS